MSQKLTNYTTE